MAYKAGREDLNELTVLDGATLTKTAGVLTVSGGGTTITPASNGGNAVPLAMNVRSGQVSITSHDTDLTADSGEGFGVTILSDKINLSDTLVATVTLAGAGAGSMTFNNISVTPSINAQGAGMYFWIGVSLGTYDMGATGANVFSLNWALI